MPYVDVLPSGPNAPETVRAGELARWLGVSTKTLSNWSKQGSFPKPIKLGPRTVLYRLAEVRTALIRLERDQAAEASS